jgi:diguanylate cyclase (GGDEF)-like protein
MDKTILNLCKREEIGHCLAALAGEYVLAPGMYRDSRITPDNLDSLFVVVIDENQQLATMCADGRLPVAVPLLLFCLDNDVPPSMNGHRFIDVLPWPCPENLIRHKLAFLHQLFRFCHQREMFLKTYDALIDSLSRRDGLTGLYNRHYLLHQLEDELQKAKTRAANLSLLILDLDNFRQINQNYGYSFGDNLLGELSARISGTVRDAGGICYRYCGGSLAVVLPRTDADEALRCAEQIRMACCAKGFRFRRGKQTIHISLSIGIASFQENQPQDSDHFIAIAETALYQAKNDGRDRIRVFSEEMNRQNISSSTGVSMLKFTINSLLQNTRATVISSLMSLTRDLGGNEQRRHSALVSRYLNLMAKDMTLPAGLLKAFENTTNLLTCVRVLLRQDILTRLGEFTDTERRLMRELPYKTAELTENFDFFLVERTLLLTQGECFDGSGAPHGLSGDQIPFTARLFKLVDAFAAMTADRPHRGRLSAQAIVDELTAQAGRQFDPSLVMRFLALIERQHLLRIGGDALRQARQRLRERFPDMDESRVAPASS